MLYKLWLIFGLTVSFIIHSSASYSQDYPPKYEFRAVWVATVANIDWPSSQDLTSEEQQVEFKTLVRFHKNNGMNALIVQIRPNSDALYASPYEPWSQWLTGEEGKPPVPFYDPLEFMIDVCREEQLEFHAWFNPFRAIFDLEDAMPDSTHVMYTNPQWIVPYGKHAYLNPGLPEVRSHVIHVVSDVARRYDIDGVHFDDYFYPYKIDSLTFTDSLSYINYGQKFSNIDDWRRDNINQFIKKLSDTLNAIRPAIKFGVSPFGVWRNRDVDASGSETQAGQTTYDDLYADVRLWLKRGWIDYVVPQVYFSIGYPPADYEKLVDWWSHNTFGRQLYIGHAAYKINNNHDENWSKASQIPKQIRLNRSNFQVDGSVYFSAKSFRKNPLNIIDSLRYRYYPNPALVPVMSWNISDSKPPPSPPVNLKAARNGKQVLLQWDGNIQDSVRKYVVYLKKGDTSANLSDAQAILGTAYYPTFSFVEGDFNWFRKKYTFVVTAVDAHGQESYASRPVQLKIFNP